MSKKKLSTAFLFLTLSLFAIVLSLNFISATVDLKNGTTLNTSASNSSITFSGLNVSCDQYDGSKPNFILLQNCSYISNLNGIFTINITSAINHSSVNTVIDSNGFPYVHSITGNSLSTSLSINSNVTNILNATFKNITVTDCAKITSIFYSSASGAFTKNYDTSTLICNNNFLTLNITNIENTNTSSNTLSIVYYTGASQGGGSSFTNTPGGTPSELDLYLCNKTLLYTQKYGQTDFSGIDSLIDSMRSYKNYSATEVQDYIIEWQKFCSLATNRTLNEPFVCRKTYYFLIDKNNSYNEADINDFKASLDNTIDVPREVIKDYLVNYQDKCYKIINLKLPFGKTYPLSILNFGDLNFPDCTTELNNTLLDASVNVFDFYKGHLTCDTLNKVRWFFNVEKSGDSYVLNGIKAWLFIIPGVLLLYVLVYRVSSYYKKNQKTIN